jgi:hypothetical protein
LKRFIVRLENLFPNFFFNIYSLIFNIIFQGSFSFNRNFSLYDLNISKRYQYLFLFKYLNHSYITNFKNNNVADAYISKKFYHYFLLSHYNNESEIGIQSLVYLFLMVNKKEKDLIKKKLNNKHINEPNFVRITQYRSIKKQDLGRFFIFGPGSVEEDFKYYKNRTLILFKPDKRASLYNGNAHLFLSLAHLKFLKSEVDEALSSNCYSKIYIRGEIPNDYKNDKRIVCVSENNIFPGLLSFNRLLLTLVNHFLNIDLVISGINYYLSSKPYHSDYKFAGGYNSIFSLKKSRTKEKIIQNLINHDILFNFEFTKNILNNYSIQITKSHDFNRITNLSSKYYCKELSQLLINYY